MRAVPKQRRISLALVAVAGAVVALGVRGLGLPPTVAPGGLFPVVAGSRATLPVSEKVLDVFPAPTLSPGGPAQKGQELAAAVCTNSATTPEGLSIPVAGVRPHQLRDTFHERRPAGHLHQALDIPAAQGTLVLAAVPGRILKLAHGPRGGIALYQMGCDGWTVYYYAHLDRYADSLAEGQGVHRGHVLGFVGATGNAGAGNYHLHFAMWIVTDPRQYWRGLNVNPYPLLQALSLDWRRRGNRITGIWTRSRRMRPCRSPLSPPITSGLL